MAGKVIFGLDSSKEYAQRVAKILDEDVAAQTDTFFDDGEGYLKSNVNVRGKDVYVIHSLFSDKNGRAGEKLLKLYMFISSLRDASAGRITAICPYLSFARQDRKTESRAPITTRYVAQLLEAAGINRFLTIDVHNLSAMQNAFRVVTDHLEIKNLMADFLCGGENRDGTPIDYHIPNPLIEDSANIVVVSPDSGGLGRCRRFRNALELRLNLSNQIPVYPLDKERVSGNKVRGGVIYGDVQGKRVIVLDDMISTGGSIALCAETIEKQGGELWAVCATHGLFVGEAEKNLKNIPRLVVADSIPPFRLNKAEWNNRLFSIPTTHLVAQAIRRLNEDGSISALLEDTPQVVLRK
jgi:ribose-phosphate pyrophosphokinase